MATKIEKQVQIIARIEIKKNGIVVYKVRSSNGTDIYQVTVVRGHVNNCTCPARKPCYHMTGIQAHEDERRQQSDDGLRFNAWHGSNYGAESLSREAYVDEFSPATVPGMY